MDEHFPLWLAAFSIIAVAGLFIMFEKASKSQIDRPGEEVLIPGYQYSDNPFINDRAAGQ